MDFHKGGVDPQQDRTGHFQCKKSSFVCTTSQFPEFIAYTVARVHMPGFDVRPPGTQSDIWRREAKRWSETGMIAEWLWLARLKSCFLSEGTGMRKQQGRVWETSMCFSLTALDWRLDRNPNKTGSLQWSEEDKFGLLFSFRLMPLSQRSIWSVETRADCGFSTMASCRSGVCIKGTCSAFRRETLCSGLNLALVYVHAVGPGFRRTNVSNSWIFQPLKPKATQAAQSATSFPSSCAWSAYTPWQQAALLSAV